MEQKDMKKEAELTAWPWPCIRNGEGGRSMEGDTENDRDMA